MPRQKRRTPSSSFHPETEELRAHHTESSRRPTPPEAPSSAAPPPARVWQSHCRLQHQAHARTRDPGACSLPRARRPAPAHAAPPAHNRRRGKQLHRMDLALYTMLEFWGFHLAYPHWLTHLHYILALFTFRSFTNLLIYINKNSARFNKKLTAHKPYRCHTHDTGHKLSAL
jgi:hypothetical protein